jgi:hypothetical protein
MDTTMREDGHHKRKKKRKHHIDHDNSISDEGE